MFSNPKLQPIGSSIYILRLAQTFHHPQGDKVKGQGGRSERPWRSGWLWGPEDQSESIDLELEGQDDHREGLKVKMINMWSLKVKMSNVRALVTLLGPTLTSRTSREERERKTPTYHSCFSRNYFRYNSQNVHHFICLGSAFRLEIDKEIYSYLD